MTSWGVIYKDHDILNRAVSRVEAVDPDFGIGYAIHTVQTGDSAFQGKPIADVYTKLLSMEGRAIEFKFESSSGDVSKTWKHSLVKVSLVKDENTPQGTRLSFISADRIAILTHNPESDIHEPESGKVSKLVKKLLLDASLKAGVIQETDRVDEFSLICQPFIPDYQFITDFLMPRSMSGDKAGYRLWSQDGETYDYLTADYQAKELEIPSENISRVEDNNAAHEASKLGGYYLRGESFDPFTKKVIEAESEDANKAFGDYYGEWRQPSYTAKFPAYTEAALNVMVGNAQRGEADYAYPFNVVVTGLASIDGKPFQRPAIVVAKCHHKTSGTVKGLLVSLSHSYRQRGLSVTLGCLRHMTTL